MNQTASPVGVQPLLFESDLAGELEQELLDELQSSFSRVQDVAGKPADGPSEPEGLPPQPVHEHSQSQIWRGPTHGAPPIDDIGAAPEQLPSFLVSRVTPSVQGDDQAPQQISEALTYGQNLKQTDSTRPPAADGSRGFGGAPGHLDREPSQLTGEPMTLPQDMAAPFDPQPEINVQASIDPSRFAPRRGVEEYERSSVRRWPSTAAAIISVAVIGGLAIILLRPGGVSEPPQEIAAVGQSKLIYDSIVKEGEVPAGTGNSVSRVVWDGGGGWPGAEQTSDAPAPQVSNGTATPQDVTIDSRRPTSQSPEQKLVRTVVVRPDGTIVSNAAADAPTQDVRADVPSLITVPAAPPSNAQNAFVGAFMVQVLSQRSEEMALASFNEMRRRYPSVLGDLVPSIQRADLGERGVYYRVRIGFPSREQATRMCENLRASGGDCFLATL